MKTIFLTRGMSALVDDEDWPLISRFNWSVMPSHGGFYATARLRCEQGGVIKSRLAYMHYLVMGSAPRGPAEIDHRDGNKLNNQKHNLRWATKSQNAVNWKRENRYGRGVSKDEQTGRFRAAIFRSKKNVSLGTFATAQEAREAYDAAALKQHGSFAILNTTQAAERI